MEDPVTQPGSGHLRLVDTEDFDQLVNIVSEKVGLLPHWIRKDYWVVRVLDALVLAPELAGRFVFKGGTSLSKAWKLIDRFSEDVDLLPTGPAFGGIPVSAKGREVAFKAVRTAIEGTTPLRLPLEGLTEGEKRKYYLRSDAHGYMRYPFPSGDTVEDFIKIEAGFRGGSQPLQFATIRSLIGEHIGEDPLHAGLAHEFERDVTGVRVPVLAPARTFVEKLLAIHTAASGDIAKLQVRHYYDLAQLFQKHSDVKKCLQTRGEFRALLIEAIQVSNTFYDANLEVSSINIEQSPALTPSGELMRELSARWRTEESLYPHGQPQLLDVLATIAEIRTSIESAMRGG
jgi:hypothetical protein